MDTKTGSGLWDTACDGALKSVHSCIGDGWKQYFHDEYDEKDRGFRLLTFLPHTLSILRHGKKRDSSTLNQHLVDVYHFTGMCLKWQTHRCFFRIQKETGITVLETRVPCTSSLHSGDIEFIGRCLSRAGRSETCRVYLRRKTCSG